MPSVTNNFDDSESGGMPHSLLFHSSVLLVSVSIIDQASCSTPPAQSHEFPSVLTPVRSLLLLFLPYQIACRFRVAYFS